MTPNIQFLINCCKVNPTASAIEGICAHASRLDEQGLAETISFAQGHCVLPLVYHAIRTHAVDCIAENALVELKQRNTNIVMHNMYLSAELPRILALLNENGIQARAFKGPALSELAYGDIALRQYVDLDILIKKQDVARSVALLTKDGYLPEMALLEGVEKAFFTCVNVFGLGKKTRVELHWELLSRNYAIDWTEEQLWKGNDTISIDGVVVPMLPHNIHLLYLCAHGSKHFFERLEWVCDIDRLIRFSSQLAWPALFEDARAIGIERMLLLGLYLCHQLLALPLPEAVSDKVLKDPAVEELGRQIIKLNFSTPGKQSRSFSTFGLLWRMRENVSDRWRFAFRAMFAPKFDDFKAVQLPGYLVFLYPVLRPFRLFFKYLRKL